MQNTIQIQLPEDVFTRLESTITSTVERALRDHVAKVQAQPNRLTRVEAAKALRVTLPTLRTYELLGRLKPKRAGRRVLYDEKEIEAFLSSGRCTI